MYTYKRTRFVHTAKVDMLYLSAQRCEVPSAGSPSWWRQCDTDERGFFVDETNIIETFIQYIQ